MSQFEAYKKCIKVIDSCECLSQVWVAERYCMRTIDRLSGAPQQDEWSTRIRNTLIKKESEICSQFAVA